MMLLHLLEAEREFLRLAREDREFLDDLLGRHLAAATALHRRTAGRGSILTGRLELTRNLLSAGHLHVARILTAAAAAARAAALAAGKR